MWHGRSTSHIFSMHITPIGPKVGEAYGFRCVYMCLLICRIHKVLSFRQMDSQIDQCNCDRDVNDQFDHPKYLLWSRITIRGPKSIQLCIKNIYCDQHISIAGVKSFWQHSDIWLVIFVDGYPNQIQANRTRKVTLECWKRH